MNRILHIVVAAGSGRRFGAELPKQFHLIGERPALMLAVDAMRRYGCGGTVVTVLNPDYIGYWTEVCVSAGFDPGPIVAGGSTRWESVKNAFDACGADADIITVHDGARPLVGRCVVEAVVAAVASGAKGAVPVVALSDSIRHVGADGSSKAVDRAAYVAVQTPQGFSGMEFRQAYGMPYSQAFTDDASVMEAAGYDVRLVEGSPVNIKVTNPSDIAIAELLLRQCND